MKITINDLIAVLSELPETAREQAVISIKGAIDKNPSVSVYQIQLDSGVPGHDDYILIPQDRENIAYDTFGERKIPKFNKKKTEDVGISALKYAFDISRNHIRCNAIKDDTTISVSILSIDAKTGVWDITFWNTHEKYRHHGYGKMSLEKAFHKAIEVYGFPQTIRYAWNGTNQYVLDWMERHFNAECSSPIAVRKTQPDDDKDSHIYVLDKMKVFEYFSFTDAPEICRNVSDSGMCTIGASSPGRCSIPCSHYCKR